MNCFEKILTMLTAFYTAFEKLKERQSETQVCCNSESCGKSTNCFFKDEEWMGPGNGNRRGPCGKKKDYRRFYLCEDCYKKRKEIKRLLK